MTDIPDKWFTEPVTVRTFTGSGSLGPEYAAELTDLANVDPTIQLVRAASGEEVVSNTTVAVRPKFAGLDSLKVFTLDSFVTVGGLTSKVTTVQAFRKFGVIQYVAVTV